MNESPVISRSGLIAWLSKTPEVMDGKVRSDIFIHQNNQTRRLTQNDLAGLDGNEKIQLYDNQIVWQTSLDRRYAPVKGVTWVLEDVPGQEITTQHGRELAAMQKSPPPPEVPEEPAEEGTNSVEELAPIKVETRIEIASPFVLTPEEKPYASYLRPNSQGEIVLYEDGELTRMTQDSLADFNPVLGSDLLVWQKTKAWPLGYEVMVWDGETRIQLTTNDFYDMGQDLHGMQVTWYGWDGTDYEIYLYDHEKRSIQQLTDNRVDDLHPKIWDGVVVWEGYPSVEGDIFMYKDGETVNLSQSVEDHVHPRIWNGEVVWQGFDGLDYEIYHYDGERTRKLTDNEWDDLYPQINDGTIVWMSYVDNWDSEIAVWDGEKTEILTDNDFEDRNPRTAARRIVWEARDMDVSYIYLAEPQ